jgi:hypothetical protein
MNVGHGCLLNYQQICSDIDYLVKLSYLSSQADSHSAGQEVSDLLWYPKVHKLRQLNSDDIRTADF